MYLPTLRVTVTVFVPLKAREVIFLFRPGPLSRKSCAFDLSTTVIAYLPAFNVLTFAVPFLSVIVKPGPVVPFSFVTPIPADVGAATATTVTRPAMRYEMRDIVLLFVVPTGLLRASDPFGLRRGDTSHGAATRWLHPG